MAPTVTALLLLLRAANAAYRPFPAPGPAKPIGPNVRYLNELADFGLVVREPLPALHDAYNTSVMKGVSYIPSTARNQLAQWHDYDGVQVRRELGFASAGGFNTVKVTLHWALWVVDGNTFLDNVGDFLAAAAGLKLGVVLSVFEGPGADPGPDGPSLITSGAYKTSGWVANPGDSQAGNSSLLPTLDAYMAAVLARFGRDSRVVGWDAYYQPNLCHPCAVTDVLLPHVLSTLAAGVDTSKSWVTASVIPGGSACDSSNVPDAGRSVVAFENYNGNRGAVGGDTCGVQACAASLNQSHPLPVILTGSMGRFENPPSSLCEIVFECYGTAFIDIPSHPPIGWIIPSLMIGVDEFSSSLNQGLIFPNGTWFSTDEQNCVATKIPPFPPPPPGPPPPGVNFTTLDGLRVGLRNSTRAVQFLGLTSDPRWFGNFSFVPPLWNFLPEKPHRDGGGAHHIGDFTIRVQPASETNESSWGFYSSAVGDAPPAKPLPRTKGEFDVSNLTDATLSGVIDGRFPLGLQVVRSVEPAPGGAPGFAIRWNFTSVSPAPLRIGGLGFSLISDSFFGGTNNTAIAAFGSFLDAHVGLNGGYATITRADGSRQLLVTPCTGDAGGARAGLEAWRPILEDSCQPNEGMWEFTVHSAAWSAEWAVNKQAPDLLDFPDDALHKAAWPAPKSPHPSWHLSETVWAPNPRPWNPPTSRVLAPGESVDYALCFSLPPIPPTADPTGTAGGPRARDAGLEASGVPVLLPVPGVVIGSDMTTAALFVLPPRGAALSSAGSDDPAVLAVGVPASAAGGYTRVPVMGLPGAYGRARVTLNFSDGTTTSAHYWVLPPLTTHSANYGTFAASTTWLPRDFPDAFGRSASFMPYDREDNVHVLQDGRPFVVGLSDDAGAGANLGMAAKLMSGPHQGQLALLDDYVSETLLGVKPDTATPPLFSLQDPDTFRILMTVWYYEKNPLNATGYYEELNKCRIGPSWCAFNTPWCDHASGWCAAPPPPPENLTARGWPPGWQPASYRQYNFPHQIATYYSLYLAASNFPNIPLKQNASWYLNAAVQSIYTLHCRDGSGNFNCAVTVGLMDGTIFREVLRSLVAEGAAWADEAAAIAQLMKDRVFGGPHVTDGWNSMDNPAGSEFAWDSTGQEEVAIWGAYFNATDAGWMHGDLNSRTVDSILGYMGSPATFAFAGAAYGMGDFSNNAKWMVTGGWEREGGHYRSGLNSIPVIERYRAHPDDVYLLIVGVAGILACLPNIDAQGAPSMAFHSHPFIHAHDPNSGDHGLAFFGSSLNAASYLHNHSTLGLLCFMCDAAPTGSSVVVTPRDTYHVRAFIEPLGLWLVAEAGRFASFTVGPTTGPSGAVTVSFESQADSASAAGSPTAPYRSLRLRVEASAPDTRPFSFSMSDASVVRGAYEFAPNPDVHGETVATVSWTR